MSTTFGLDIGTKSIKELSIKRGGNTLAIESLGIGPTPVKGIMLESPEDIAKFIDAIKQVVNSAGIKQMEVHIALPES